MTKLFENAMKSICPDGDAQQSNVPCSYDMSFEDAEALMKMAVKGDPFHAVRSAFMFGFVMGNRATHSRKLRRL